MLSVNWPDSLDYTKNKNGLLELKWKSCLWNGPLFFMYINLQTYIEIENRLIRSIFLFLLVCSWHLSLMFICLFNLVGLKKYLVFLSEMEVG